ncbi:CCA tRNA nucleotidyltransferase [Lyngbya confervoides]|uniref:CCA tRNA nucleotidyltransferase n=1 Tax=Lyngbya confervoides BDU141951 TaxID=1574623 RepID=A0ABD4T3Z1_9CYAN|nr:CCA tRNA nucleotidyltransferase [Lyngbya confervoides]MCM1983330.1 CCA tRNA nucleotidyltransferase [Lyngbya confervoides BDU141951]
MQSVLNPQSWPFELEDLPNSARLVGGGVRDALLGHSSGYLDLDFVVKDSPVSIAQAIARRYQAGYVLLDAERQIARVVFPKTTADFALQVGKSLEEDLHRRDFTINAIAYRPHDGKIMDPLNGYADLQRGTIRMISEANLRDDPLRLMRAYRQAAQLNFTLDPETQNAIREFAPLLSQVAAERIKVELGYLLSSSAGTPWLSQLYKDGLLEHCFPNLSTESIARLAAIDEAEGMLSRQYPDLASKLHQRLSDRAQGAEALRRTVLSTVKLLALVALDPDTAEATLLKLKYSRNEIRLICTVIRGIQAFAQQTSQILGSKTQQYQFFQLMGKFFPAFVVVNLAMGGCLAQLQPLIHAYGDPSSPVAHPQPLLSGYELIQALHLSPGPNIGKLLTAIAYAQAEGQVHSKAEAIAYARRQL